MKKEIMRTHPNGEFCLSKEKAEYLGILEEWNKWPLTQDFIKKIKIVKKKQLKLSKTMQLNLTVSGKCGSGNSYLIYELKQLLAQNGWNVEFDKNSDENQIEIDLDVLKTRDEILDRIAVLKQSTKIVLFEKQLPRIAEN
jgi:hypothetical protein